MKKVLFEFSRWVLFLPSALVFGWLAYWISGFLHRLGMMFAYQDPNGTFSLFFEKIIGSFSMGVFFVAAGSIVAPRFRFPLSILFAFLGATFAAYSAYLRFRFMYGASSTTPIHFWTSIISLMVGLWCGIVTVQEYVNGKWKWLYSKFN